MMLTLLMLAASTPNLEDDTDHYTVASINGRIGIYERGKHPRTLKIRLDASQNVDLSPPRLASLAKINFVTARCAVSNGKPLQRCRISEASVQTDNARSLYTRILEAARVVDCSEEPCPDTLGSVYLKVLVPNGSGKVTNRCFPPFCAPTPPPPPPPAKPT